MQHPQAHTEVTVWLKGTSIPEQEAARTRVWPTASSSLPSWHGQTSLVPLDQPNLYPSMLTLAISGARGSIGPTGRGSGSLASLWANSQPGAPRLCPKGSRGAPRGQTQARAKGTQPRAPSSSTSQVGMGPFWAGVCLHTAQQSRGKGSSAQGGVQRQMGVICRGCAGSPGAAMHCTGDEAAPSLWLQHPGGADCCTDLDSSSVGMSSLLPGQFCDPISPSCSDSVLPSKPQGSASSPKQCSAPVLAPTAAASKCLTHSLGVQGEHHYLYPHSHTGSCQKAFRAFKAPFIAQDVSMATTFTSHHWLWKASGHQQLQVS